MLNYSGESVPLIKLKKPYTHLPGKENQWSEHCSFLLMYARRFYVACSTKNGSLAGQPPYFRSTDHFQYRHAEVSGLARETRKTEGEPGRFDHATLWHRVIAVCTLYTRGTFGLDSRRKPYHIPILNWI